MATKSQPALPFNSKKLERLAAQYREDEAVAALTAAASGPGDLSRQPKLTFKEYSVTKVQAAVSPDCSYRLLMGALNSAKVSITAYVYNIGAPYILELLKQKLAAGVKVRVMVDPNDPSDQKSLEWDHLKSLKGIDLKLSPSTGTRRVFTVCHQKYVVVDGKTVVVESANWAVSSIPVVTKPGEYKPGNREWLIRVNDSKLAAWFEQLFQLDWDIPDKVGLSVGVASQTLSAQLLPLALFVAPAELFDIKSATKPVTLLPLVSPVNYLDEVSKALNKAKNRIYIQQQYIIAGKGVNDLLRIVHKKSTSCQIEIVVSPKFAKAWQSSVDTLRAAGLGQFLRAQNLQHVIHCHNKGLIIDNDVAVVSSTNWSENSILRARETGFLITSQELNAYYASVFDEDWQDGVAPQRVGARMVAVSPSEMV